MYENIRFQYYKNNVNSSVPVGFITLDRMFESIRNPKPEMKELLTKIQNASNEGNIELKTKLKENLYAFTPAVIVEGSRKYDNVKKYTGLAVLDFDKIDNAIEFKKYLFNEYPQIIASWLSPSKKGVKGIVKIPEAKNKQEFKSYTFGISAEMEIYKGFDIAINNAVLLMFIGWDENILIRDNPETWTRKGIKINDFENTSPKPVMNIHSTDKQKEWVVNWYTNKINAIIDNGHPQLRDNSVSLGGYVGAGYISLFEAISLSEYLIANNPYLKKGVPGYQKTAKQSINLGLSKPLYFNEKI